MGPRDWGPGAIDSGLIVNAFHAYNLGLRADVFFEYVRSAANPADMPSRDAMGELWDLLGSVGLAQRARDSTRGADRPSLLRHLGRSGGPAVRGSHEPLRPPLPWQAEALRSSRPTHTTSYQTAREGAGSQETRTGSRLALAVSGTRQPPPEHGRTASNPLLNAGSTGGMGGVICQRSLRDLPGLRRPTPPYLPFLPGINQARRDDR